MRYLFILVTAILISNSLEAQQVGIRLNFNVGSQPVWGPTGYDHAEYYYMPDIETYYYVPGHMFYYQEGGRWVGRSHLPSRYHDYDFYHSYKVVVNERQPYLHHATYRDQYSSYGGRHDQQVIRDSHDSKYYVIKDHPQHRDWFKQLGHDNGNRKSNGKGNGNGNGNKQNKNNGNGKDKNNDH